MGACASLLCFAPWGGTRRTKDTLEANTFSHYSLNSEAVDLYPALGGGGQAWTCDGADVDVWVEIALQDHNAEGFLSPPARCPSSSSCDCASTWSADSQGNWTRVGCYEPLDPASAAAAATARSVSDAGSVGLRSRYPSAVSPVARSSEDVGAKSAQEQSANIGMMRNVFQRMAQIKQLPDLIRRRRAEAGMRQKDRLLQPA
jgi:hypothetical protein